MANYSYQSSSYGSSGGGAAAVADSEFQQADINSDGRLDIGEFRRFIGQNLAGGASSSSVESASYEAAGAGYESSAVSSGLAGAAGSYESSSFSTSGELGGGASLAVEGTAGVNQSSFESSSSVTQVQQYATDAQGLFRDPDPQIIRRPAAGGVQTYTQNIKVRFLQPPPIPPPGPLIIKEVRPPQPAPPPPLRIRQQAPPLPQPPPLILREKPPAVPAAQASQTVIRRLAALPVPPRSVIIERLPALPPRPRDIIIERWIPYGAQAKRRTVIQRAAAAQQYTRPRNVIIQYEPIQVRVVRQFQRLGVVQANPQSYLQQYGAQLLDATTLLSQARSAGVVEDISPPAGTVAVAVNLTADSYGQQSSLSTSSGYEGAAGAGLDASASGGLVASSYESSSYASGGAVEGADAGFATTGLDQSSSSVFESSSYSSGEAAGGSNAAFNAADTNRDGTLDQAEFRNFVGQNTGAGGGSSSYQSSSYSSQGNY